MSSRDSRSSSRRTDRGSRCNDNLCHVLKEFVNEEVSITTKTGEVITGTLKRVRNCVVKVFVPGSVSPVIPGRITFVRCEDIESFSIDLASS